MYPRRERFDATPLALVAAEVRFTDSARLRQQETLDRIQIALEDRFPLAHKMQQTGVQLFGGPVGAAATAIPVTTVTVLTSAEKTEAVTIGSSSVIYETTTYGDFEMLLGAVREACQALLDAGVRPALQRVGLRYIDEVRVPTRIDDVRQWSEWIDHRLVDYLDVGSVGHPVRMTQAVTTYDLGEGRGLNFRFAALNQGPVVSSQLLRRSQMPEPGPFFVLDYDGYQEFEENTTVLLEPDVVCSSLDAVHDPTGEAFQASITDKARDLFRGDPT